MRKKNSEYSAVDSKTKAEMLYLEYRNLMISVANGILGDTKDSEDVVHQSFLKIMKIIDKIDETKCHKTKALVVTVVERTAIDLYRRRQCIQTVLFDEDYICVPDTSALDTAAERIDLGTIIARLPARYRQVLLLRYDVGLSCGEVAKLLSMTEAGVRKTVQRAKGKLAALLEKEGVEI